MPRMESYKPSFSLSTSSNMQEKPEIQALIDALKLQRHPEGGYFVQTDKDELRVPNPFTHDASDKTRSASTTIFYLLTPTNSFGAFHRNKARTVHTLHKGRGRYVLIHADECEKQREVARVETFIVGQNVAAGEKLQWIVDGGKYKASFLLPDNELSGDSKEGLLISETVVPGFEFSDHDFLTHRDFAALVPPDLQKELSWLLRND